MLTRAKSANVGFSQVDFPHAQTQLTLVAQKIPFINSEKHFLGVNYVRKNIRL